jgi:hypothetical protein
MGPPDKNQAGNSESAAIPVQIAARRQFRNSAFGSFGAPSLNLNFIEIPAGSALHLKRSAETSTPRPQPASGNKKAPRESGAHSHTLSHEERQQ